jgi:soluble lytic murein transglycosylase-like protein
MNEDKDPIGSLLKDMARDGKISPEAAGMEGEMVMPAMSMEQEPEQESMAMPAMPMEQEAPPEQTPEPEAPTVKPEFMEFYPVIAKSKALDTNIFDSVQHIESRDEWDAKSESGAIGWMQIKPTVAMDPGYGVSNIFDMAENMGVSIDDIPKNATGAEELLYNPEVNRAFGEAYLEAMYDRFDNNVANSLIAYKEGPGYVRRWLEKGGEYEDLNESAKRYLDKINRHMQGEDVYGTS